MLLLTPGANNWADKYFDYCFMEGGRKVVVELGTRYITKMTETRSNKWLTPLMQTWGSVSLYLLIDVVASLSDPVNTKYPSEMA